MYNFNRDLVRVHSRYNHGNKFINALNLNDMRVYQTDEIKNIALLGSAGSGKTTLAESMLYGAGIIKRRGSVEAKNTVSDYFPLSRSMAIRCFLRFST